MSEVKLSIVIPCYNEELSINNLLIDIYDNFEDFKNYEIILVDDGSRISLKDKINSDLKKANLVVIRNEFNKGQTASIKIGIQHSRGSTIGLLDGDGQNPPSELKKMYEFYLQEDDNYDAIVSFREKRKDNLNKRITNLKNFHQNHTFSPK